MPQIWMHQDGQWNSIALGEAHATFALTGDGGENVLLAKGARDGLGWALLANPNSPVRVNGESVSSLGIHVLRDRDAIQLGGNSTVFFSIESTPVIAPFAGEKPLPCARCKTPVHPGDVAVQCPRCGAVHHQDADDELACWTHTERCGRCHVQSTSLDPEPTWTPAEL